MTITEQLEAAQAEVERIKREIAGAPCAEVGHRWKHIGGSNAGCDPWCCCSVPVHKCAVCGDCDYGDNAEAREIRTGCTKSDEWIAGRRALADAEGE